LGVKRVELRSGAIGGACAPPKFESVRTGVFLRLTRANNQRSSEASTKSWAVLGGAIPLGKMRFFGLDIVTEKRRPSASLGGRLTADTAPSRVPNLTQAMALATWSPPCAMRTSTTRPKAEKHASKSIDVVFGGKLRTQTEHRSR